jgi:hypothetical protein
MSSLSNQLILTMGTTALSGAKIEDCQQLFCSMCGNVRQVYFEEQFFATENKDSIAKNKLNSFFTDLLLLGKYTA